MEYRALVAYASSLTDTLLFIHYLAVVLIEIRHLQPTYYIKVISLLHVITSFKGTNGLLTYLKKINLEIFFLSLYCLQAQCLCFTSH